MVEGLFLIPAYGLPLLAGTRLFSRAADRHFRYGSLAICALATILGLPIWYRVRRRAPAGPSSATGLDSE